MTPVATSWHAGRAFTDAHLNAAIKSIAAANGAAPDFFSSHSLRSGGVTAALATGLDQAIAMREGRWLSVTSLVTYIRLASNLGAPSPALQTARARTLSSVAAVASHRP